MNKAGDVYGGFASQETNGAKIAAGQYGIHYLGPKGSILKISEHIHTNITEQIPVILDGPRELEYEGVGLARPERGSTVNAPPAIRHAFVSSSNDSIVMKMSSLASINAVPVKING